MASCPEYRHIRTNCYYYRPPPSNPTQIGSTKTAEHVWAVFAFMKTVYGYQLFAFI